MMAIGLLSIVPFLREVIDSFFPRFGGYIGGHFEAEQAAEWVCVCKS